MLSPRAADPGQQFPAIGIWVRYYGWIEVGRRKEAGIVVRALDDSRLVFESTSSPTLAEALAVLEQGLAELLVDKEAALPPSSPPAKSRQRRPRQES
jgi:hypothetical protein